MRNVLLGTLAGLAIGTLGALAYSHFQGNGPLAQLQADLDAAKANLAKANATLQQDKNEIDAMSAQIQQLTASNDALKHQGDDSKPTADAPPAPPPPPAINPMMIMGMMRGAGGFQGSQKLLLLKSRLHLTPDQETAVKAAMDADAKQRQDLMRQMFGRNNNGQANATPASATVPPSSLDQALATILTPDQQATYKQVQTDEKNSQADTMATVQVNQVSPLLQLSESQKDQVFNALYQVQLSAPDPATLLGNPNAASILAAQSQATDTALAQILTPDQLALYQQEAQSTQGFGRRNRGAGGGGGATATAPGATAPAATAPAAPATAPAPAATQ